LDTRGPELPDEWRILLRAHLDNRAGRRQEAIDAAQPLLDRGQAEALRRAAAAIVVRALIARGDLAEATGLGLPLLDQSGAGVAAPEKLRLAALLFNALTLQGACADECGKLRRILEKGLEGSGLRERLVSAGSLGLDAFRRGAFETAGGLFEIAHEAAIESGDSMQIAGARANLGGVYFEAGRLAESEDLNQLALAAYEEMQERAHAAVTRRNPPSSREVGGVARPHPGLSRRTRSDGRSGRSGQCPGSRSLPSP
jgi:tetratricopeptide (TPR) repeat protein